MWLISYEWNFQLLPILVKIKGKNKNLPLFVFKDRLHVFDLFNNLSDTPQSSGKKLK
jgi:hypothetical protein